MNPLIIKNHKKYLDVIRNQTENKDGRWVPAIPFHKLADRCKAALIVLKGNGFVIDVSDGEA